MRYPHFGHLVDHRSIDILSHSGPCEYFYDPLRDITYTLYGMEGWGDLGGVMRKNIDNAVQKF